VRSELRSVDRNALRMPQGDAKGVSCDTGEIVAGYRSLEIVVKLNHLLCVQQACRRPSRKCPIPELRAGAVKARSRAGVHARSARSAEALTAAEHSSRLARVMARLHLAETTRMTMLTRSSRRPTNCPHRAS
jgi:hypothetical protein